VTHSVLRFEGARCRLGRTGATRTTPTGGQRERDDCRVGGDGAEEDKLPPTDASSTIPIVAPLQNKLVASETMEDYSLRYAPPFHFRRWSEYVRGVHRRSGASHIWRTNAIGGIDLSWTHGFSSGCLGGSRGRR